ncbi:MAG: hypothetical protein HY820_28070 [Acidobacteria bacterium]|nr:hypothetical protein [Acidobacteriota bacterium]
MTESSLLPRLLAQVRRRALTQLMAQQGSLALSAALAALILLLLLGTQVLAWYWPVLLLVVVFAVGVWRVRGRVPSTYDVAQKVDQQLGFADAISTAVYFQGEKGREIGAPELIRAQRGIAEQMAAQADAASAAPLFFPREAWVCFGLLAVSAAMLVVRYGVRGSLDLSQPLVRIPFTSFSGAPEVAANRPLPKQKLPEGMEAISIPTDGMEDQAGERKDVADDALQGESIEGGQPTGKDTHAQVSAPDEEGGKDGGEGGEKGEGSPAGDQQGGKDGGQKGANKQNAKNNQGANNKNAGNPSQENSSLMDKMRDAMANMLSRMKMNPQQGDGSKQNAQSPQGASQQASAAQKQGQKGSPAPGKQGDGQSKSDEAGEQEGEGASKNMNAQGKVSDSAGAKQQAQEGKSGAGKQDGEKEIKQAEQAAAMGKISEILGKRAQNLTGEVMVEVSSGRQALKTQYTNKSAAHSDAGGEIPRDEVPAAYQQYVQQYFEEIRKSGAPKPAAETKAADAKGKPPAN